MSFCVSLTITRGSCGEALDYCYLFCCFLSFCFLSLLERPIESNWIDPSPLMSVHKLERDTSIKLLTVALTHSTSSGGDLSKILQSQMLWSKTRFKHQPVKEIWGTHSKYEAVRTCSCFLKYSKNFILLAEIVPSCKWRIFHNFTVFSVKTVWSCTVIQCSFPVNISGDAV